MRHSDRLDILDVKNHLLSVAGFSHDLFEETSSLTRQLNQKQEGAQRSLCYSHVTLSMQPYDYKVAEGAGFEPAVGYPTFDFESSALNRTQPPFLVGEANCYGIRFYA